MEDSIEMIFSDSRVQSFTKAIVVFMTFFGTKYVALEIADRWETLFESESMKFLTLFSVFYRATDKLKDAFIFTLIATYLLKSKKCKKKISQESVA